MTSGRSTVAPLKRSSSAAAPSGAGRLARRAPAGLALLLLGLVACAPDGLARDLDRRTGRMTREEAEERFGPPTRIMAIGGQEIWSYEDQAVVGAIPGPRSPVWARGTFVGHAVRRQVLLHFDARGVLSHWERF